MGPACSSPEMIRTLIREGMDVARLNFSHGTHEEHLEVIKRLKEAREELDVPLAIMLDTKGPEIRIGSIREGSIMLPNKHRWRLLRRKVEGDLEAVTVHPFDALTKLPIGARILLSEGYISTRLLEVNQDEALVEVEYGGEISSKKGVNLPNINVNLPAVTEKDIEDLRFGCQHGIDIIAASFVRTADHVLAIKKIVADAGCPDLLIVAKIENTEGVANFDSILRVADGIMVARGDLGVEVPLCEVPGLQKKMIRKSYLAGKPSITATQMLESMIQRPRPTRAEVSDVANAIYDSTSAVMLSGETAVGKYPLEVVRMMRTIVEETEKDCDYAAFFEQHGHLTYPDITSSVTLASVKTAYSSNSKAIFAFTSRGGTARLLSRLRPSMPILAFTPIEKTYHQLALVWGVTPLISDHHTHVEEAFKKACCSAVEKKLVEEKEIVVMTAGTPFGTAGTTNMMVVKSISCT